MKKITITLDEQAATWAGGQGDASKGGRAIAGLDLLWREQRGRTRSQVLSESYVVLKRLALARGSTQDIWHGVQKYFVWNPLAIDDAVLRRAHEIEQRFRISWWDSMILAAAPFEEG